MLTKTFMSGAVLASVVLASILGASATAQDAVQWSIDDGGNGHWYQILTADGQPTWQESADHAVSLGGHLVAFETREEYDWCGDNIASPESVIDAWIGIRQEPGSPTTEGWNWITGVPAAMDWGWFAGEPNDADGNTVEDCAYIYCDDPSASIWFTFRDVSCDQWGGTGHHFIEWSADCNNDGIVDYGQILDGTFADDDGDGVPDLCNAVQWHVEDGGNGHWYRTFFATGISWAEAEQQADGLGGHLSSLTSAEENGFVVSEFAHEMTTMPWIGLRQDNDGDWGWNTGEPYAWTNWSPSEPNGGSIEVEANIWLTDSHPSRPLGTWNDYQTPHPNGGLIEWSADCNGDGIVDFGQILDGSIADCNNNYIPDVCELSETLALSVDRTPDSPDDFIVFDLSSSPDASSDVELEVAMVGDLEAQNQFAFVFLDEVLLGYAFVEGAPLCERSTASFVITSQQWNDAGLDGERRIRISGLNITTDACAEPLTEIALAYEMAIADCNDNGTWDECESDGDGDGVIDGCDGCPDDPEKTEAGACGCGVADIDSDDDGIPDCSDSCPFWPGDCSEDGQTLFVVEGDSIQQAIDGV
ncbi:MAG: C-type lectin domain-containing protein, partial [Phycisphaerales bacterium]|nr:C-type lectin domain-containing protein [Phycisphaerales bacterium]